MTNSETAEDTKSSIRNKLSAAKRKLSKSKKKSDEFCSEKTGNLSESAKLKFHASETAIFEKVSLSPKKRAMSHGNLLDSDGSTKKRLSKFFQNVGKSMKKEKHGDGAGVEEGTSKAKRFSKNIGEKLKSNRVAQALKKMKKIKSKADEKNSEMKEKLNHLKEEADSNLEAAAGKVPGGTVGYDIAKRGVKAGLDSGMIEAGIASSTGVTGSDLQVIKAVVKGDKEGIKDAVAGSEEKGDGRLSLAIKVAKGGKKIYDERSTDAVVEVGADIGKSIIANEIGTKMDAGLLVANKVSSVVGVDVCPKNSSELTGKLVDRAVEVARDAKENGVKQAAENQKKQLTEETKSVKENMKLTTDVKQIKDEARKSVLSEASKLVQA